MFSHSIRRFLIHSICFGLWFIVLVDRKLVHRKRQPNGVSIERETNIAGLTFWSFYFQMKFHYISSCSSDNCTELLQTLRMIKMLFLDQIIIFLHCINKSMHEKKRREILPIKYFYEQFPDFLSARRPAQVNYVVLIFVINVGVLRLFKTWTKWPCCCERFVFPLANKIFYVRQMIGY